MAKRFPYETAGRRLWPKLEPEARRMRAEPTEAEERLWQALRHGKLGARFRRQHAIDRFIVDFICLRALLIIEVDGEIHATQVERDLDRDARLRAAGYHVIRFSNEQVLHNLDRVLQDIRGHLNPAR